jgi:predicted nucleotidyltransferase component of viral defense system
MIEKEQALLAQIIDLFAQRFDRNAVLCGGMVLRILGSPRLTNDLDYAFIPFKSKNDILDDIVNCLKQIPGSEIRHAMNSKCLRIIITVGETSVQVEVKTAMKIATSTTSTRLLSPLFNLPPRTIKILDFPVAMANKMAAWNERRLIRDLYDIWFFCRMNVLPDEETLTKRLLKPDYSRTVKKADYFKGTSTDDFFELLRKTCASLTDSDIEKELSDYLPVPELAGLSDMFRAAFATLHS